MKNVLTELFKNGLDCSREFLFTKTEEKMRTIRLFLIFQLIFIVGFINAENGEATFPPEAIMDYCYFQPSSLSDLNAMAIIYGGKARYYENWVSYGYNLEYYQNGQWVEVYNWEFFYLDGPNYDPTWYYVDQLVYVGQFASPYGDGNYRVKGWIYVDSYEDLYVETNWSYGTVEDTYTPATPSGFGGEWYSSHPKIEWNANSEYDVKEYVIYKRVDGGNWSYHTTSSSTSYVDYSESQYTPGQGDRRYVDYKISARDYSNNESGYTSAANFICNEWLNKETADNVENPLFFELYKNYPNPFNPSTTIEFQIPNDNFVNLTVYNSQGEEIMVLLNEPLWKGKHKVVFDARNLPSGIYIYRINAGTYSAVNKMILIK